MANSVDPDQTAPIGAVYSGSTLFATILNSSVMLGNYLQQTTSADNIFRCIFSWRFKSFFREHYQSVKRFESISSCPSWSVCKCYQQRNRIKSPLARKELIIIFIFCIAKYSLQIVYNMYTYNVDHYANKFYWAFFAHWKSFEKIGNCYTSFYGNPANERCQDVTFRRLHVMQDEWLYDSNL